jgi:hypothetical protein
VADKSLPNSFVLFTVRQLYCIVVCGVAVVAAEANIPETTFIIKMNNNNNYKNI